MRILARLEHPGIVPIHDLGRLPDGRIFYAMKMVEGQRLDVYARSSANLQERLRVFSRICEAVAFARSEEHTSELQSRLHLVCRLLLEKKKKMSVESMSTDHNEMHRRTCWR